jgi:protein ImuA
MEEALRSKAVSAVLGELNRFEPMAARRLQLAAQAHATTALALWPGKGGNAAGFAESRWRLANLPSPGPEIAPHWRVTLMRARRSGAMGEWAVRWRAGGLLAGALPEATPQTAPQATPQPAVPAGVRGVSSVT